MALAIGDYGLASRLMIGDLGANSSFYHKLCYTKLYNKCIKKDSERKQTWAVAWDKVIAFMNETQDAEAQYGFEMDELEDIYLEYLSKHGVFLHMHVTRFFQELLERAPNYEKIKDGEIRVCCKESVCESFSIFCQSSQILIDSIRAVIQPVIEDISQKKKSLNGTLQKSFSSNINEYVNLWQS